MEKSADAFRSIGEVADELAVPKHVLRFWEAKFSQVKPMKLGGGRRFYRPEDVDLLRGIRQLLYDARYTIKGVQKILRRDGVDFVKNFGRDEDEAGGGPENAEIPDLANEAAREAAKDVFGNSSSPSNGRRTGGGGKSTASSTLHPIHGKVLGKAVDDLEWCRKRLTESGK